VDPFFHDCIHRLDFPVLPDLLTRRTIRSRRK
jgi:hypothetical protein